MKQTDTSVVKKLRFTKVSGKLIIACLLIFVIGISKIGAQIIFEDGFEAETLDTEKWGVTWWTPTGQLDEGMNPEIVTSPVRAGNHAVKVQAKYNWNNVLNYSRTELTANRNDNGSHHTFFYPGKEYWIGFSVYLPNDWQADYTAEELVFQLHGNGGGRPPSMGLYVNGDNWYWYTRWGAEPNGLNIDGKKNLWEGAYEKGEWVDFVIHAKWAYNEEGNGFLEIWKNGVSLFTRNGPNCYNDDLKIRGPQTGIYKWNWANGNGFDVSERTVYLDEYRVGEKNSTYTDVAPGSSVKAAFTPIVTDCNEEVSFENKSSSSYGEIDSYLWDFGDGQSSTEKSPAHTYITSGVYNVKLLVVDSIFSDSLISSIDLNFAPKPTDRSFTKNDDGTVSLSATGTGTINWYDVASGGTIIGSGSSFVTPVTDKETFYVENAIGGSLSATGGNTDLGIGNYYKWEDEKAIWGLEFNSQYDFTLQSVKVYNGESETGRYTGERTFVVTKHGGDTVASSTVNVVEGEQRLQLDMSIPAGNGYFLLSDSHIGLWRTIEGTAYPYAVGDYISIIGGVRYDGVSAGDGYHFFYDWEVVVDVPFCTSKRAAVGKLSSVSDKKGNELSFYPNPVRDYLKIKNLPIEDDCTITIYNSNMQETQDLKSNGASEVLIDFSELSSGIYFCMISSQQRTTMIQKVVVIK